MRAKQKPVGAGFRLALICFFISLPFSLPCPAFSQGTRFLVEWQSFERMVRDGNISDEDGERAVVEWADRLERAFPQSQSQKDLFFPLRGYSIKDVGGKSGDGYKPKGYRFLDGNRHQGHPAQDIFVRDRNQDGRDDLTGTAVDVLALAGGIVLSAFSGWNEMDFSREIRGGNYVWIYHPALRVFSYSAHLDKVFVRPGDKVPGGGTVATLGRSGKTAVLPRSPTHLHLMILSSRDMQPVNPYPLLKSSRSNPSSSRTGTFSLSASKRPAHQAFAF